MFAYLKKTKTALKKSCQIVMRGLFLILNNATALLDHGSLGVGS